MSKILSTNYVQKKLSEIKDGSSFSVNFNQGNDNSLILKNGKKIKAGCLNCANPECMKIYDREIECVEFPNISHDMNMSVCPVNALKTGENQIEIDEKKCIGCGLCASRCPFGAIYLKDGKAKVSVAVGENFTSYPMNESGIKRQDKYVKNVHIEKRTGVIQPETDHTLEIIYKRIKRLSQEQQNIFARNLLICLGNHATLARQGNVYMRMDGFYSNSIQFGVVEIETGADMLDVSRAILDDVAVVNARYNVNKNNNKPVAVMLSFPNKRTDYWQVLKDIRNIVKLPIATMTFGALLILLWNNKEVTKFDQFYVDVDNSSIRHSIDDLLGRKAHISDGFLGILENGK